MQTSYFPLGDYTSGLIQYVWTCSRCEERYSEKRAFCQGGAIWIPDPLPGGWHKVDGDIYCPAHSVQVSDAH